MTRKLSAGIHNVRVKKPSGGTRMAKVKVLKSGKWKFLKSGSKARAKPRATSKAKATTKRKSNPAGGGSTASNNKTPKIGAAYVGLKATALVLSPLSDVVLQGDVTEEKVRAKGKEAWNGDTAKGAVVLMADQMIAGSKKINHAAALSRRSLTALAPESYLGLTVLDDVRTKQSPRVIHARAVQTVSGFNPTDSTWGIPQRMRTYYKVKAGGIILRKALGTKPGRRITRLLRPTMQMVGVTV